MLEFLQPLRTITAICLHVAWARIPEDSHQNLRREILPKVIFHKYTVSFMQVFHY